MSSFSNWRHLLLAGSVGVMLAVPVCGAAAPAQVVGHVGPAAVDAVDNRSLTLALAVRERAMASSDGALKDFAERARARADARSPAELQHVINQLIEQNEFDRAASWNRELGRIADPLGMDHYVEMTKVNDLMIRRLRDGQGTVEEAEILVARQQHWLPRVMARDVLARILLDDRRPAEAMHTLVGAMGELEKHDGEEAGVAIALWQGVSLIHAAVDDLPGFMSAVEQAEALKKGSTYPRPEYESLYWLALSLGSVGRYEEARATVAIYSELADRTGTPLSRAMAGTACGLVETASDNWSAVLNCYAPFGPTLDAPVQPRQMMLPRRATAYARMGHPALALKDLEEVRAMVKAGTMRPVLANDRAEAEYLIAVGDYARGIPMLRNYHLTMYRLAAQRTSSMMEQAVVSMDEQLHRADVQTELKSQIILAQRWLMGLGTVLALMLGIMFFRQRALARSLAQTNRAQAVAQARQAELFTNVSHEIRTPLNGVVAMADALGKTRLPPEAAKMARIMSSSANTLERLMSDILDIAKIEAGQLSIEQSTFCLKDMLDDIAALWAPRAREKGLEIVASFGEDTATWVVGDPVRLCQVLNNLISNALKFTEKGKVVLSAVAHGEDRFVFAVTDTGVGFDMRSRGDLFQRFRQADSTITRRFGGTGLGLPISQQLIGLMGGELDCASEPGQGAQFWFELELPRVDGYVTPSGPPPVSATGDVARYLIVDDNATNRTIVAMLLQDESRQLHFAENGREAVDMAATIPFNVILMDVQMPVMSGIEAIRAIRANEQARGVCPAAIVVLSANADSHHQKEGVEAGADGHIAKPIVLERLLQGIDQAIATRAHLNAGLGRLDRGSAQGS